MIYDVWLLQRGREQREVCMCRKCRRKGTMWSPITCAFAVTMVLQDTSAGF